MKNFMKGALTLAVLAVVVGGAVAQKPKPAAPKTMTCPACKMAMGMKKTKAAPVAVKTKNGTFYCCAGCAAGKEHSKSKK